MKRKPAMRSWGRPKASRTASEYAGQPVSQPPTKPSAWVAMSRFMQAAPVESSCSQSGILLACLGDDRSEEHTSELQSLMRISYAVFCLKKKKPIQINKYHNRT